MSRRLRTVGLAGGVAGALVAGVAVGLVRGRRSRRRRDAAGHGDQPGHPELGELPTGRGSVAVADDGVTIWVEETSPPAGGRPALTVVFAHGFVLDRRMWHFQRRDLAELTAAKVRLVAYDHRSHGRSGHSPRRASTIDQLAMDLDAVLRVVAPHGPVVLVGHSMGAMTVMALAEQRPELFADRVAGVAMLCTSAGGLGELALAKPFLSRRSPLIALSGLLATKRLDLVERARRLHSARPLIRTLGFGAGRVDPAVLDLVEQMIAATSVEVMTDFAHTLGDHDRYRALAGLRHCQVLVLAGDADRVTPYSHTEAMAAQLPDAELVRVPGAGHLAMLERPEFVNEHLAAFLDRCATALSPRHRKGRRHER